MYTLEVCSRDTILNVLYYTIIYTTYTLRTIHTYLHTLHIYLKYTQDLTDTYRSTHQGDNTATPHTHHTPAADDDITHSLTSKLTTKCEYMMNKFNKYHSFIEHVLDMSRLPLLEVDPSHDPALRELREERDELYTQVG